MRKNNTNPGKPSRKNRNTNYLLSVGDMYLIASRHQYVRVHDYLGRRYVFNCRKELLKFNKAQRIEEVLNKPTTFVSYRDSNIHELITFKGEYERFMKS